MDSHCSKCCPIEPPAVQARPPMLFAAWVWFGGMVAVVAVGWWLIVGLHL